MKNILILTSEYCGKAKANGICAKALAESFGDGVSVYVVSADFELIEDTGSDKIRSVYVPMVVNKNKKRSKLFYAARLLKNMLIYSYKVNYNKHMVDLMLAEAEKICRDISIDAVICMYFPLESVIVGSILKKHNSKLKLIIYELDSVEDGIAGSGKFNRYMLRASKRTMNSLYNKSDLVMVMECHKSYWTKTFLKHKNKMILTDLPLLKMFDIQKNNILSDDKSVSFLYAGNLDRIYRSPKNLIEVFKNINLSEYTIDFFSKGCEDELDLFSECCENVRLHGYVEQNILTKEIEKTNVLLSIGNSVSNSLPSKIITYISYGKPIIHFCLQKNDICKKYLNKYPLSLIIENDENSALASRKIIDFLVNYSDKQIEFDEVSKAFQKNHPSYSTNMILGYIENKENNQSEEKV